MKKLKLVRAVAGMAFLLMASTNTAFCDVDPYDLCGSWWSGCYTQSWSSGTLTVKDEKATADQTIGANPCNETTPPSKTASTTSGSETGYTWEISGGLSYDEVFNVSAEYGASRTTTYGASCSATINQWCAEAHQRAGVKHDELTLTYTCSTDSTDNVSGTKKSNYASYCESVPPDSTSGCKATCP